MVQTNNEDDLEDFLPHYVEQSPRRVKDFEERDVFETVELDESTAITRQVCHELINELSDIMKRLQIGSLDRSEEERLETLSHRLDDITPNVFDEEVESLRSQLESEREIVFKKVKEIQVKDIMLAAEASEKVDLAFVIDCTGSMAPHIQNVKDNIKKIVRKVRKVHCHLSLRLALVGYRDINNRDDRFEILDFTSSMDEFERFLSSLRAISAPHRDRPEDIAGAVRMVNRNLSWSNSQPTRIVFLIADYPCHGSQFHNLKDHYPHGTPGIDIKDEFHILSKNRDVDFGSMSLYFGRITSHCDNMISVLQADNIDIKPLNMIEPVHLVGCVTKSVRNSIFKTMTVSGRHELLSYVKTKGGKKRGGRAVKEKNFSITEKMLSRDEWEGRDIHRVKLYRNRPIKSIEQLMSPIEVGRLKKFIYNMLNKQEKETTMFMRRAEEPFAEGGQRIVFHAQISRKEKDLGSEDSSAVLKCFKHIGRGVHDLNRYFEQMEISSIACFLARKYNQSPLRPSHCATIDFLQVCVIEEESDEISEDKGERRFCAEHVLNTRKSPFTRFSNNLGYWDEDHLDESLLRFTAWTHAITDGYLLVTDLQGIKKGHSFTLSDPAILCTDLLRFGGTNLGATSIDRCKAITTFLLSERGWL